MFTVFDNSGDGEVEINYKINAKGKSVIFFPESDQVKNNTLSKKIPPKETDVFIVLRVKQDAMFEVEWSNNVALSGAKLEKMIREKGTEEALDQEGELIQRYLQIGSGYGLLIENKSRDDYKMKLILENLSFEGKNENEIFFDLKSKTFKTFDLKVANDKSNSISFQFQFAD
jgi:hypothetical protein